VEGSVRKRKTHSRGHHAHQPTCNQLHEPPRDAAGGHLRRSRAPERRHRPRQAATAGMHFVPGPGLPGPAPAGPGKAPGRWGGRCPARRKSPLATCKIDHRRGSPPAAACGRAASKPASRGLHVPRPSACRRWLAAATLDSVLTAARARLHRLRDEHKGGHPASNG